MRVNKALYGLKQAPNCWNHRFDKFLKKFNLIQSAADECIYFGEINGIKIYLALYVDDGLLMSKSEEVLNKVLAKMTKEFEIRICEPNLFVGLEIERNKKKKLLKILQTAYINKVLEKYGMIEAVPKNSFNLFYETEFNLVVYQGCLEPLFSNR